MLFIKGLRDTRFQGVVLLSWPCGRGVGDDVRNRGGSCDSKTCRWRLLVLAQPSHEPIGTLHFPTAV